MAVNMEMVVKWSIVITVTVHFVSLMEVCSSACILWLLEFLLCNVVCRSRDTLGHDIHTWCAGQQHSKSRTASCLYSNC